MELSFIDNSTGIKYFDAIMVCKKLNISKSKLTRSNNILTKDDYFIYKTCFLYSESAVDKIKNHILKQSNKKNERFISSIDRSSKSLENYFTEKINQ